VGFLDKAKKLAEQAKQMADQAREAAEGAIEARTRSGPDSGSDSGPAGGGGPAPAGQVLYGTPYVPGMLGRPGWRERGLADPAAVLPIADRDRVGVPHPTRSEIVDEPFGMGRRWSAGARAVGLFYQLYPEHLSWSPPGGLTPVAAVARASQATLSDGRAVVLLAAGDQRLVLETAGIDDAGRADLLHAVLDQLGVD